MDREEDKRGCPSGAGTVQPEHGGRIGNPPHVWSQEVALKVRELGEVCGQERTARLAGISLATLKRHYYTEWQAGQDALVYDLKAQLIKQAKDEKSVNATVKLLVMAGEFTHKHEHSGPGGGPIRTLDQAKLAELAQGKSNDELRALVAALDLVLAATRGDSGPGSDDPDAGLPAGGAATPGA